MSRSTSEFRVKHFQALQFFFADHSKAVFLCGSFLLCMFNICLYCAVLSVTCSLLCCVFLCCVTFLYGVPGQVWYLIVAIPDPCLPLYSEYYAVTGNVSATCFNWSDFRYFPDNHKKTDAKTLRHQHVLLIVRTCVA